MGEMTSPEAELVEAAALGNVGAFSELVRQYRARVVRTAYGIVGSIQGAEDVAQEAFIKLWNTLPHYRARGAFGSWLYRIVVNSAIDALRRRRDEVPLDELQSVSKERPEESVLRGAEHERVREAIRSLPPSSRAALVLREYEQLSYKEIAEVLQVPIGTVMSRLHYARHALRKKLDPHR